MVSRMDNADLVEDVILTMQGEIGSLREQCQKIPNIKQTMAKILSCLNQIIQF